jgi:CubicO group peptidase (beta-lactamase class C family)
LPLGAVAADARRTRVAIVDGRWHINGEITYPGTRAEGLLLNVRMVNSTFEDRDRPDFDPDANTDEFIARIPEYVTQGVRAFTLNLQGGMPGYEGAVNSAFNSDGTLRESYLRRVQRVIDECDRHGVVVILGCYYQRQDQILKDADAVRAGVVHVIQWIRAAGFTNVVLEISNEFDHDGFDHGILKTSEGQVELIQLAKKTAPDLLVATSGLGHGRLPDDVASASDFLLIHFNGTPVDDIPDRIALLKKFNKPIVCNEDDKTGRDAANALTRCVDNGASYGLMLQKLNQTFPFEFKGAADDPVFYDALRRFATKQSGAPIKSDAPSPLGGGSGRGLFRASADENEAAGLSYFPPPESQGGWRQLTEPDDIRQLGGADADKLNELRDWLLASDDRDFAAVVIRNGYIVLEIERGNIAKTDSRRVASVSKAICATVLAIASEQSQQRLTPRKMTFDDPAFDFIPWAKPLSDSRKAQITVRQLFNHTSGICPESTGAPNDGTWEYVLGHTGDERTAKLAFDPGAGCGYSTHAFAHAALVCETVTGKPYDQFAIESLFKPLGIEHWRFQFYDGGERYGRHPSHGLGMPARDLARIAYCMMRGGKWHDRQIIPKWFVDQTTAPTHTVETPELRWKLNPQVFSHGWELPARHSGPSGRSGAGIPHDARAKPGSGGQLIAFVPSLHLVVTRQTGSSGQWQYEEYLRRACDAMLSSADKAPTAP